MMQRRTIDIISANMLARKKIFVSYCHKDGKLFEEFKTMLAPAIQSGLVDLWDDRKILPGAKWKEEIEKALTSASVAVLLVSQNFLASHFIAENELPPLLKAAREEGVTIFWIYLSSCLFEQTEIASYQAAHDTSRPLDRLSKSQRQAVLSETCAKLIRTTQQAAPPVESGSTEPFAITLDADFDFIGGEEGAKTAAYRFLARAGEGKIIRFVLHCEALGIADEIVKELESQSCRSSDEEQRLRHACKVRDRCKESGRLFEQALDFIWYHTHFKSDIFLNGEDGLGELIVGLRDLTFAYGPVLPGRTTTPEWFKLASQRSNRLFTWHVDKPKNHLIVGLTGEDTKAMEAYYESWTRRVFSDSSACHAHGLSIGALRRALVPCIAVHLAERFRTDETAYSEDLSRLQHWVVARSSPDKVFNSFTWEKMMRLQSSEDRQSD
jgi:TIR domain